MPVDDRLLNDLREEVAFWRREAIAAISMGVGRNRSAELRGDEQVAAETRNYLRAILAALQDADAKEWHERCFLCGQFMLPTQERATAAIGDVDDIEAAHAKCLGVKGFIDQQDAERIIALAREIAMPQDQEEEEPENAR